MHGMDIRIEPLKSRHDVTKLNLTFHFLFAFCINIDLSIQTHITCIVHDLSALKVARKIQVMGSLLLDD